MITAIDKNTALVLIDLQKGITRFKAAHPLDGVIGRSVQLANAFRSAGLPVVVVRVDINPNSPWLGARRDESRIPKNKLVLHFMKFLMGLTGFSKIVKELDVQPSDLLVTKHTPNAFFNTGLHETLQKHRVTGIVLAGVATSNGVEATARAASERGYNISFASDAMTDTNAEAHENSLQLIFPRMGEVGTAADILEKLGSRV